ncbi:hypothetical protein [Blautia obeum]|uniref:hypothetical protein n=1 Tax=Blautia obeum TaxID=40520 RepID=UPI0022DEA73A|nr:hypothetical protein [Blautia obeum]
MNYSTRNIIKTYSAITGNEDEKQIVQILSKSPTFMAVKKGNPVLMYEGYSANLMEIVDELRRQNDCPEDVKKITAENIAIVNRARKNNTRSRERIQKPVFGRVVRRTRKTKVAKMGNIKIKRTGIMKP